MSTAPIKRHEALKSFSREHHHGLLFCWKIREGLKKNVELERIKKYADWFWLNHLKPHFEEEEQFLFPILDKNDTLIKQAEDEHLALRIMFENHLNGLATLQRIQEKLQNHIRFEERVLFQKIQNVATDMELEKLLTLPNDTFCDNWKDEFWVTPNTPA